jgi:hypothetical protein
LLFHSGGAFLPRVPLGHESLSLRNSTLPKPTFSAVRNYYWPGFKSLWLSFFFGTASPPSPAALDLPFVCEFE